MADQSGPDVCASFLVTREDYADYRAAAGKFAMSPGEFLFIRLAGVALLLCCFVFLLGMVRDWQRFALDALLGICGLFLIGWKSMLPIWLRARAGKLYDENNRLVEACTVTVGGEGIAVEKPRYQARLPYAMIAGAYEDKKLFLFSLGAGMLCFLPKRCLTEEECSQIRKYLSLALQEKFQQEGAQING